ncbi:7262_t:CDS:2 [Paraglomus brasilianum]|uniref:1,3-beta-glucan synthase n=1 Tax=Paraglomus brasilianum TaxID=144538 RepID=A0A9N8VZ98_9GLOM|nr:7262_t:CDS:2 [Paraglomus brasilianum]
MAYNNNWSNQHQQRQHQQQNGRNLPQLHLDINNGIQQPQQLYQQQYRTRQESPQQSYAQQENYPPYGARIPTPATPQPQQYLTSPSPTIAQPQMAHSQVDNRQAASHGVDDAIYPADKHDQSSRRPVSSYYGLSLTKDKQRAEFDEFSVAGPYEPEEEEECRDIPTAVPSRALYANPPQQPTASHHIINSADPYSGENSNSHPSTYGPHRPTPQRQTNQPYPAWSSDDHRVPVSKEEIEDSFIDLKNKFGFQEDSMRNMYDHLMCMLDSRASRMTPAQALITLHADFIGGENANYRKWYFAAYFDFDDARANAASKGTPMPAQPDNLESAEDKWRQRMASMSQHDRVRQLALYLLLWGEASQIRFVPECLCFLFKLADDYYRSPECKQKVQPLPKGEYLRTVVTPLYKYIRDQGYEVIGGKYVKREKDHADTIGYDDINQLFWRPEFIARISITTGGTSIMTLPPAQRYMHLKDVNWNNVFVKTYEEKRTWLHAIVNFTRIWIIHVVSYWYYTAYNAPFLYMDPTKGGRAVQFSVAALGGAVATLFMIAGCVCEFMFIQLTESNIYMLGRRLLFLFVVLAINAGPTYYVVFMNKTGQTALFVALGQLFFSVVTTLYFSIVPSAKLLGGSSKSSRKGLAARTFTANYPKLPKTERALSIALWVCVFSCKLVESYFFLSLSFKDPLKEMHDMVVANCGDSLIGNRLCTQMPRMAIVIMFFMDLVLFFLDTYLWYIIWGTIFSVCRAFYLGISIWTPWKYVFSELPKRIYVSLLCTENTQPKYKPKALISQIWNAIVISMYREHLLSLENVKKLLYTPERSNRTGEQTLQPPEFFTKPGESKSKYFPKFSEAERRFSFFGQSLSITMPDSIPVQKMPTFTVLVPHYSEKILLSLKEIIGTEDQSTRVTLLEYLKQQHPIEWDNFVRDTKALAEDKSLYKPTAVGNRFKNVDKEDDLAFYSVGFKSSAPEFTLRTRIWASLRAQTLYRTISGFMNYSKAIKLLYRVENPEIVAKYARDPRKLEQEIANMASRKFKFVITMQRYCKFNAQEQENADFLLHAYPDLQIAYLDEVPPEREGEEAKIFSVLIDGYCKKDANGKRIPKYRIQLPGNPILGDGKSDNQNHAIIFYRGEFLQLVDANQDNYLEECLKIRNVLGEFEVYGPPPSAPYSRGDSNSYPVAIVGAREYIFSENYGVLGDVAAGKEQTFGTLTARLMALIGAKLHYGHPDFLNAIFMTTRGGVSKAQKGLHLNEDIYAGMNAFCRGGRIKHSEYYQCGKGRDLGFGSILHFTTKIGTGMGEQMLSREYYYLGTQLPLDRFLTFYYAHPGFHLNNIFIMLSVTLFMLGLMFIGALASVLTLCETAPDPNGPIPNCYNFIPVLEWIKRSILSIFLVFFIAFLPLFFQELTEKGFIRSSTRLGKHFMSLSPFFEVFATQIYAHAVVTNLTFGGARYIATGRGFATARIPFSILYSRFAGPSIYLGMRLLLLLLFISLTIWVPHLAYFWVSVVALCISPFLFNPHQFSLAEFIIDYREFLRWMSRGNSKSHKNSWIDYCRVSRTMITGYKRKRLGHPSEKSVADVPRPSFAVLFASELFTPFVTAILCTIAYTFVKSFDPKTKNTPNTGSSALIRVGVIAIGPIMMNAAMLVGLFIISICMKPMFSGESSRFGSAMAFIAHGWAVINLIGAFELLWYIESWSVSNALVGIIAAMAIQRFTFKFLVIVFLSREFKHDEINLAWWTGRWDVAGNPVLQAVRELICKIVEMSLFAADFILGHILLFILALFCLIPFFDKIHSMMLFWLRPSKQIRKPILSASVRAARRKIVFMYGLLFLCMAAIFAGLVAGPIYVGSMLTLPFDLGI